MNARQFLVTFRKQALDKTREKTTATLSSLITRAIDAPDAVSLSQDFIRVEEIRHPLDSHWDEDPQFPVSDWQYEVQNDDTRLGYKEWVLNQRENADE